MYLNDVILFSKTNDEHHDHLDQMLTALLSAGVLLKLQKCGFFTENIKYLGHFIMPGIIEADGTTTAMLRGFTDIPAPINDFLMVNPLTKQFSVLKAFQEERFRNLIEAVINPSILTFPPPYLQYSIDADACESQVKFAILQFFPYSTRKLIGFWYFTLNKAELNYPTPEK